MAANCFYRFDQNFACNTGGSTEGNKESSKNQSHSAYAITQENLDSQDWYMDSGASHHVTNDSSVIDQGTQTSTKSFLVVGNGERINIESKGKSCLSYSRKYSPLKMNNLLHVPKSNKNLVSTSQLTSYNDLIIIFD